MLISPTSRLRAVGSLEGPNEKHGWRGWERQTDRSREWAKERKIKRPKKKKKKKKKGK